MSIHFQGAPGEIITDLRLTLGHPGRCSLRMTMLWGNRVLEYSYPCSYLLCLVEICDHMGMILTILELQFPYL